MHFTIDIQWMLDFGYKIVIPWLLHVQGISEQNTLTLGLCLRTRAFYSDIPLVPMV